MVRHSFGMAGIKPVVASAGRRGQVSVATAHLANLGWNLAGRDSVRLVLLRGEDYVTDLATYPHAFSLEELTDSTYTDTLSFAVGQAVGEGLYRVCPAVREPDGTLTLARASTGTPSHVLLRVSQDSLTLAADESRQASIELLSWQFPDSLQVGQRPPFEFTVRNNSTSEYCGSNPNASQKSIDCNAPTPAPMASIGMNAPHGTPADIFTMQAINLHISATASVTATPQPKGERSSIIRVPPPVPSASMRACPPPIA